MDIFDNFFVVKFEIYSKSYVIVMEPHYISTASSLAPGLKIKSRQKSLFFIKNWLYQITISVTDIDKDL